VTSADIRCGVRAAGVRLLLLQFSPQREEMERFGAEVISRIGQLPAAELPAEG